MQSETISKAISLTSSASSAAVNCSRLCAALAPPAARALAAFDEDRLVSARWFGGARRAAAGSSARERAVSAARWRFSAFACARQIRWKGVEE